MAVNMSLLLTTTCVSFLSSFSQMIVNAALMICCKEAASASNVIGEISKVTTEISGVSMMDEFARHARLQRKLIKLRDELKSEKMTRNTSRLKLKVALSSAMSLITGFLMLFMLYMYRSEAVVTLPESWLSPFCSIVSWPSQETGAVSVLSWIAVCRFVSRLVASKFN